MAKRKPLTKRIHGSKHTFYSADPAQVRKPGPAAHTVEAQLRKLNRTYALLSAINQAIVRMREPRSLFEMACRIAVEQGGFCMAWIGLLDPLNKQVSPVMYAGEGHGYLDKLHISLDDSEHSFGPTATAIRTGQHIVVNDIANDPRMEPWRAAALQSGYRASAAFPLIVAGEVRGTLNLYASEPAFFNADELTVLDEMAADIAFALAFTEQEEQRKWAETHLRQSEERFRTLYETMLDGVVYQNRQGEIISANPAAERILGMSLNQMRGLTSLDPRWHAINEDGSAFNGQHHPAMHSLRTGLPVGDVVMGVYNPQHNSTTWININAVPQFLPGETTPFQVYATFRDITRQKQDEHILQKRLELMNYAADHSFDTVMQKAVDQLCLLVDSPVGFFHELINDTQDVRLLAWSTRTLVEFCEAQGQGMHYALSAAGVWADAARTGKTLIANDYPTMPNRKGLPTGHTPLHRVMVVPIIRNNHVLALIGVGNKETAYSATDLDIATRFADYLWDVAARKQAENEANYRQALLEKVIQLGKNMTAITDLPQCLNQLYRSVQQDLGFDRVGLFLYDSATDTICAPQHTPWAATVQDTPWNSFDTERSDLWHDALHSPSGMTVISDYQATYHPAPADELYGVKQHIIIAAWAGDTPVALISVDNLHSQRTITPADIEALQLFAGYAGLAIQNAHLHAGLEQRIKERTAEVQDLYDNAPNGYHSIDEHGIFVMVNQTELRWLGYTREEVVGKKAIHDLLTPQTRHVFTDAFPAFKVQGSVHNLEYELIRKDGSSLPILLNATAIYDTNGKYVQSRSTIIDITERKRAEQALRESEERLNFLLAKTPAIIFTMAVTTTFTLTFISESVRTVLGYEPEQYLKQPDFWLRQMHPADISNIRANTAALMKTGHAIWESRFQRSDGVYHWLSIGVTLRRDDQGQPLEIIGYAVDINEEKNAQHALQLSEAHLRQSRDELSLANAELSRAVRAKDEFLANMSHELRTPLNAILAISESLQEQLRGPLNERQMASLRNIEASGRHLLALINDILDLSKVEAGGLDVQRELVAIADVCQASLLFVKQMATKKTLKLAVHLSDQLAVVEADPKRLKQMLVNLLSNAVKFTPVGGKVSLYVTTDAEAGVVRFTVEDTGIGIAPADMARLFQPFMQLDSSLSRQHEGTGLGLALVRHLAELHCGSVMVESELGAGSRFTIALPYHAPVRLATAPTVIRPVMLERVYNALVIEASESAAEQLVRYLQELNIPATIYPQSKGVLEHALRVQPNLIFLDLMMPGQSGWELLAQLKADPRTQAIPVIIVSVVDERRKGLAAGAAAYLVKPVTRELLRQAVNTVMNPTVPTPVPTVIARATSAAKGLPVLLVEDNEANILAIGDYLEDKGYQLTVARNGYEALDLVRAKGPAVILMDIQMPEMDGLEATRRLRAQPEYDQIPIIALTALAMPGDRERCLATGANEYLTKPVSLKWLIETIERLVKK